MSDIAIYPVTVAESDQTFPVIVSGDETIQMTVSERIEIAEKYTGSYTVTPANEDIVLNTRGKMLTENLTVEAIPSNYGLITWDGSVITVS